MILGIFSPYAWCAILGTAILGAQSLLAFFGGALSGGDAAHDGDVAHEGDVGPSGDAGHDSWVDAVAVAGFHVGQVFTIRNAGAFFSGFGYAGIFFARSPWRLQWALFFGALFVVAVSLLMSLVARLAEENIRDGREAVGEIGTVRLPVSGKGGRIAVVVSGMLEETDAVSEDGGTIGSGEEVEVIGTRGGRLVVRRVERKA